MNYKQTTKNVRGFTLIELMIYMGLLGILILLMSQVFIATLGVKLESARNSGLDQDGKYILERLEYDIHRAADITAPAVGQTASSVELRLVEGGVERPYVYASASGNLLLTAGGTVHRLNSNTTKLKNFRVSRVGNSESVEGARDTLLVSIILETAFTQKEGQLKEVQYQTTIGLR